ESLGPPWGSGSGETPLRRAKEEYRLLGGARPISIASSRPAYRGKLQLCDNPPRPCQNAGQAREGKKHRIAPSGNLCLKHRIILKRSAKSLGSWKAWVWSRSWWVDWPWSFSARAG